MIGYWINKNSDPFQTKIGFRGPSKNRQDGGNPLNQIAQVISNGAISNGGQGLRYSHQHDAHLHHYTGQNHYNSRHRGSSHVQPTHAASGAPIYYTNDGTATASSHDAAHYVSSVPGRTAQLVSTGQDQYGAINYVLVPTTSQYQVFQTPQSASTAQTGYSAPGTYYQSMYGGILFHLFFPHYNCGFLFYIFYRLRTCGIIRSCSCISTI